MVSQICNDNQQWGRFLNADGIVGEIGIGANILSHNMYAYTNNNPTNNMDPSGEIAIALPIALPSVWEIVKGLIIVAPIIFTGVGGKQEFIPKEKTPPNKKNNTINNNSVYTLNDINGVQYVGRTTQIQQTINRHNSNPARTGLSLNVVGSNLSRTQARGLEQMLIMQCRTLNKNNPKNNQINGVSPYNPNYSVYWDAAKLWSSENLTPCR